MKNSHMNQDRAKSYEVKQKIELKKKDVCEDQLAKPDYQNF